MKPNSVIIFQGNRYELCKAFGLFGKENLIYQSEFDHRIYTHSKFIKYFFSELNCDIIFISNSNFHIDDLDLTEYENKVICLSESDILNEKSEYFRQKYENCKLVFIWMYGEVITKTLFEKCKKAKLDLLLSGSNQKGIEEYGIFDYKLNFKFFYYYIGYYYLTSLVDKLVPKLFDENQLPIFTYSKATNQSSWRNQILNKLHTEFPNKIYNGSSINDSYDLEFTKYKHFETINDYSFRNYNLIFETIDYGNNIEYFVTEKTFKGLFFNTPFYLIAPNEMINNLKNDFYLLNSDFANESDFVGSENLKENYNLYCEKSKDNFKKLLEYIKDYKYTEHFKKLLYGNSSI
jgi:hypothetical protein